MSRYIDRYRVDTRYTHSLIFQSLSILIINSSFFFHPHAELIDLFSSANPPHFLPHIKLIDIHLYSSLHNPHLYPHTELTDLYSPANPSLHLHWTNLSSPLFLYTTSFPSSHWTNWSSTFFHFTTSSCSELSDRHLQIYTQSSSQSSSLHFILSNPRPQLVPVPERDIAREEVTFHPLILHVIPGI